MATITAKAYYIGTYEGTGKTSGKAYKQIKFLEYSDHFESWDISPLFVKEIPDICKSLKSGDLVELELRTSATQKPELVTITKKLADSPLNREP